VTWPTSVYVPGKAGQWSSLSPLIDKAHRATARRLATSIQQGTVTASLILRKLGSYRRQNSLALALREIGRMNARCSPWPGSKILHCVAASLQGSIRARQKLTCEGHLLQPPGRSPRSLLCRGALLWFYPRATEEVSGGPLMGWRSPPTTEPGRLGTHRGTKNLVYPVTLRQSPERPINRVLAWYRVGCATPGPPVPFFAYRSGQMAFSHRDNGQ
jgi:hypothetical protein